jgi:hypothetical protein
MKNKLFILFTALFLGPYIVAMENNTTHQKEPNDSEVKAKSEKYLIVKHSSNSSKRGSTKIHPSPHDSQASISLTETKQPLQTFHSKEEKHFQQVERSFTFEALNYQTLITRYRPCAHKLYRETYQRLKNNKNQTNKPSSDQLNLEERLLANKIKAVFIKTFKEVYSNDPRAHDESYLQREANIEWTRFKREQEEDQQRKNDCCTIL